MSDLRAIQRPLKERYREAPRDAVILTTARCVMDDPAEPRSCTLEAGPLRVRVGAHEGVGGTGAEACSGDLLLASLAACQQITVQMVAAAMGLALERCEVTVSGELDLRGTLGLERGLPVGYQDLTCIIDVGAPDASPEQLDRLVELARRYCVVHATLKDPPQIEVQVEGTGRHAPGRAGPQPRPPRSTRR